jgi:hypothetical protein
MAEDVCFERVLSETEGFGVPESAADLGMYELKDEAYDEIDPFYFHYARNRREEVENVLKARQKNPSPRNQNSDPVIVPGPWRCEVGPFKSGYFWKRTEGTSSAGPRNRVLNALSPANDLRLKHSRVTGGGLCVMRRDVIRKNPFKCLMYIHTH